MHKVSVITPVYNCAQYLEETVASVRAQNYADWELILWDDGSTDKTPEICRKLAEEDSRIRFFRSEKNRGVSLSRLSAVKHAEGRFLAFLDGDDVWSKDKLSTQVIFMLKNKYPISHTEYAFINAEGKLLPRGHLKVDREVDLKKLMKTTQLGLSTVMVDRRQIGKTVPFPEKRTLSEDTAAWMSLMRRGFKSYGIPRVMMLSRPQQPAQRQQSPHGLQYAQQLPPRKINSAAQTFLLLELLCRQRFCQAPAQKRRHTGGNPAKF